MQFEFGDDPVLDPAFKDVMEWTGEYKDFPHGPMFWVDRGDHIELKAVGSVDGTERHETICTLKKTLKPEDDIATNEDESKVPKSEFLTVPNITTTMSHGNSDTENRSENGESIAPSEAPTETSEVKAIEEGELVPASRPEPKTFVTASDGLKTLSLEENEKLEALPVTANGTTGGPHLTATANALDPAVKVTEASA